jgi:hypothetical protein
MNFAAFERLISDGLAQPSVEPSFFSYPSGYQLIAPSTSYSVTIVENRLNRFRSVAVAKLEPSS